MPGPLKLKSGHAETLLAALSGEVVCCGWPLLSYFGGPYEISRLSRTISPEKIFHLFRGTPELMVNTTEIK